jgi:clan AA aspartic protease (TIGR02281 family)
VGEVVSSGGERVPGASVTLEGIGSTTTDPLGRFRFGNVPAGNYRIVVSREGFSTESRHLLVLGGRRNEIPITLSGSGPLVSPYEAAEVIVPIERRGAAILVRARVNDQLSGFFVVDTGATLTAISRQAAESAGIWAGAETPMVSLQTAGGIIQAPLVQIQSVRVGEAEVKEVKAVVLDLPGFPPQIAGLLGLSFLGRFKVSIDVENGRMILGPP